METKANIDRVDSCEMSINAKGKYSAKIKVYAECIEDAVKICKDHSEKIRKFVLEVNNDTTN